MYSFIIKSTLGAIVISVFHFSILFGLYPTADFLEEKLNVCFIDNFKKKSEETISHGDKVVNVFEKYNKEPVNIVKINYKRSGFQNLHETPLSYFTKKTLNSCDLINYSMGSTNRDEFFIEALVEFIEQYDGKIIAAAGNENLTYDRSEWSYLRKEQKDAPWNSKFSIVSQGEFYKTSDLPISNDMLVITTSHGKAVDYAVDYEISKLNGIENYKGSSFSAPVITALFVSEIFGNYFYEDNGFKVSFNENKKRNREFEDRFHLYKTISKKE